MNELVLNILFYVVLGLNALSVGIALFSIKDRRKSEELYLKFSVFTTLGIYTSILFVLVLLVGMQILKRPMISPSFAFIVLGVFLGMVVLKVWGLTEVPPKSELRVEEKNPTSPE